MTDEQPPPDPDAEGLIPPDDAYPDDDAARLEAHRLADLEALEP